MPRLLSITASLPEIRKVRRVRVLNFQQITMPYLASRVPRSWDVIHVDEGAEDIDWNIAAESLELLFIRQWSVICDPGMPWAMRFLHYCRDVSP